MINLMGMLFGWQQFFTVQKERKKKRNCVERILCLFPDTEVVFTPGLIVDMSPHVSVSCFLVITLDSDTPFITIGLH